MQNLNRESTAWISLDLEMVVSSFYGDRNLDELICFILMMKSVVDLALHDATRQNPQKELPLKSIEDAKAFFADGRSEILFDIIEKFIPEKQMAKHYRARIRKELYEYSLKGRDRQVCQTEEFNERRDNVGIQPLDQAG